MNEEDDHETYSQWLHKHMAKKGRSAGQVESLMSSGTGLLLFQVWEAAVDSSRTKLAKAEQELARVKEELENRDILSIHSCHHKCQRPMCVLRRELEEARREAERYRNLYADCEEEVAQRKLPWEITPSARPQIPHEKHP